MAGVIETRLRWDGNKLFAGRICFGRICEAPRDRWFWLVNFNEDRGYTDTRPEAVTALEDAARKALGGHDPNEAALDLRWSLFELIRRALLDSRPPNLRADRELAARRDRLAAVPVEKWRML